MGEITHQEAVISDITLILEAAEFAAARHQKQKRKGKSRRPYIGHCIEVAATIATVAGLEDPNVLAAALLHDTVEDTRTTREEIREQFGSAVDDLVAEVTDDKRLKKQKRKQAQIDHAPHLSPGAKVIKLADKISNVREIAHDPPKQWSVKRREKYFDWANAVVVAMGDVDPELESRFAETLAEARAILKDESGA